MTVTKCVCTPMFFLCLLDSIVAVAPFLDKTSDSLKEEFIQIFVNRLMTMNLPAPFKSNKERNDGKTILPFRMLVAYAKKPRTDETDI